jgi:hypothetical protein
MSASNTLENAYLNALRNVACQYAAVWMSLHKADPTDAASVASGNEASGGSYTRQQITFAAAANGSMSNSASASFTGMPSGTFSHFGLWSSSGGKTEAEFLWSGELTAAKTVDAGDTLTLNASQLTLTAS